MPPLEKRIKHWAGTLGFELVGIAPATAADGFGRLREWLDGGLAGDMHYMHRHADARRHPSSILPEVRSVVMVGMNYGDRESRIENRELRAEPTPTRPDSNDQPSILDPRSSILDPRSTALAGKVARYARGADYHTVLRQRLKQLLDWVRGEVPACRGRAVVDTAPLLERDFARRAGLGWFGKNTMLLNKRLGSYFFLGALLLDLELRSDAPHETSHCGTCTACLDACPTQAFPKAGQLDARRCISYLTIELRGPIPEELRGPSGDWLFGCDVCQEVCPWNRKAPAATEAAFRPRPDLEAVDLVELLGLSEAEFGRRFGGTALLRPGRRGLLRNAAIVLGNLGDAAALPPLRRALADPEPLVREAAAWAIDQITSAQEKR
ncbi:MAG TPA: tRNA epoxyqueuosine(34) reductase QueG [Gemmataceae bacterium]|jgi:epoxyqueuosine reductase|nr:tRNA epoxyqueuosine(34) reductase QueG [Gemmataceae bacterium]